MMDDLFAHARATDPRTSKDAAAKVNVTKGQRKVLDALAIRPMTQEEVAMYYDIPNGVLGPRFKPLREKRRIKRSRDVAGKILTRKSLMGRNRQVYELQLDQSLWREAPPHKSPKARIKELEATILEIQNVTYQISVADICEGILSND